MHGYCAPVNIYDTLIPGEIRAEAEETVEHRSYNATQHNRVAVLLTDEIIWFALRTKERKTKA